MRQRAKMALWSRYSYRVSSLIQAIHQGSGFMGDVMQGTQIAIAMAGNDTSGFGFDGGADQYWMDVLASALSGLVLLPLAFLFVWALHQFKVDRWLVVSAIGSTIFSVVFTSLADELGAPIYLFLDQVLQSIGVSRFMYLLSPTLLVCFSFSLGLAWWLKRNRPLHSTGNTPSVFE